MAESDGNQDVGYADGIDGVDEMDAVNTLTGDDADEPYETSYSPPDYEPSDAKFGMTHREELQGEGLERKLSRELPDLCETDAADDVKDSRAGRLVAPDGGMGEDTTAEEMAWDAGIAGAAASAEEAAVHIIGDPDRPYDDGDTENPYDESLERA